METIISISGGLLLPGHLQIPLIDPHDRGTNIYSVFFFPSPRKVLFFPVLLPGEGKLNVSEAQIGQLGSQPVWSLEAQRTHWRAHRSPILTPSCERDPGMGPSPWRQGGPGCWKKASLERGLMDLALVQNRVRRINHHNGAGETEGPPCLAKRWGISFAQSGLNHV